MRAPRRSRSWRTGIPRSRDSRGPHRRLHGAGAKARSRKRDTTVKRRHFLAGAAVLMPVVASAQSAALRERVLGAWRIRDAETVNVTTGTSTPWLGRPRPYSGTIVYLPNG